MSIKYGFNYHTDENISNLAMMIMQKSNALKPVIGVRLSDKYNRIEHLITNHELKENDESLEDTLLDMAGYSILALKYLKEHKKEYENDRR